MHINKKAKIWGCKIPQNWKEILHKYRKIVPEKRRLILFSWLFEPNPPIINASAMFPGCVFVNAEWAQESCVIMIAMH